MRHVEGNAIRQERPRRAEEGRESKLVKRSIIG